MISFMNKRAFGLVALVAVAFCTASRPANAQDAPYAPDQQEWQDTQDDSTWFDDNGASRQPAAPLTAPVMPGRPQISSPDASAQGPQTPGPQAPPELDNEPETDPQALNEFRPTLDPYGAWLNDPKYGTVWVPNREAVGEDFAPYVSAGHWALTDDGDWIWQSDYPFGGVVFHYGRWVWVPGTGWGWVAGRRYANAWVNWRVSPDGYGYVGWAPMAPAWGWYGGAALSLGWYPPSAYVFCPSRYAFSYRVHTHIVRDRGVLRDVASHTRNYWDGRAQHAAASPRVLPANSSPPRGPSLQSARIPNSAAPVSRVPVRSAYAGARLNAAPFGADGARRTFSTGARPLSSPSSYGSGSTVRSFATPSSYARPRPAYTAPLTSGYRNAPSPATRAYSPPASRQYSAPSVRQYSAPATRYSPSVQSPAYRSAPSFNSSPSMHSAPSFNSSPSMHSAPSFNSAPSHSFHSPSRR